MLLFSEPDFFNVMLVSVLCSASSRFPCQICVGVTSQCSRLQYNYIADSLLNFFMFSSHVPCLGIRRTEEFRGRVRE